MAANALVLPGSSGEYASAPDSVALSIDGSVGITLLSRQALDDWTPAVADALVAKYTTTGNQLSYSLHIQATTGFPVLTLSGDGSTTLTAVADAAPTVSDGAPKWILACWRNSDNRVQFFTADGTIANPAASDFTQLGTDKSINLTGIFNSTAVLEVGSRAAGTALNANGKFYRAKIYDGVFSTAAFGGTLQFDANFVGVASTAVRTPSSFTESSANGATVTLNGTTWQWFEITVAGTQATETDTANSGAALVIPAGQQATESDTANGGTSAVVAAGAQASTADSAFPGTPLVVVGGSQADETDTANAGAAGTTTTGSQASESDTANPGVAVVSAVGTQAVETDTAQPGVAVVVVPGSQVDETDTAFAGQAESGGAVEGAKATEVDTANTGTAVVVVAGSLAAEVDSVFAGAGVIRWPGLQATETDSAFAGAITTVVAGQQATETDTANSRQVRDANPRRVTYTEPSFAVVHQDPMVTYQDTADLVYQEG